MKKQTNIVTFGDLKIGDTFKMRVLYAKTTVSGTKTSDTHAKIEGRAAEMRVGRKNEVTTSKE